MGEQKNVRQKQGGRKPKKEPKQQPQASRRQDLGTREAIRRRNILRNLARDAKRAKRATEANRPRGTARMERRRLERLAAVEQAALPGLSIFNQPEPGEHFAPMAEDFRPSAQQE